MAHPYAHTASAKDTLGAYESTTTATAPTHVGHTTASPPMPGRESDMDTSTTASLAGGGSGSGSSGGGTDASKKSMAGTFRALAMGSYYSSRGGGSGASSSGASKKRSTEGNTDRDSNGADGEESSLLVAEQPYCDEERFDMELPQLGDLIGSLSSSGGVVERGGGRCDHGRVSEGALLFLQCGFRELLKCRQVWWWSLLLVSCPVFGLDLLVMLAFISSCLNFFSSDSHTPSPPF